MSKKNLNPESVVNELKGQSVFFRSTLSTPEPEEVPNTKAPTPLLPVKQAEAEDEPIARTHERANARMHKSTNARLHENTDAQKHESTDVHDYRTIVRRTVDLYLDQNEQIDELVLQRRKELKRHVKIGEVVREIIDFYFEQKSKQ